MCVYPENPSTVSNPLANRSIFVLNFIPEVSTGVDIEESNYVKGNQTNT